MIATRIGYKIISVAGISITLGILAVAFFSSKYYEETILSQNKRTMGKLTESVIQGLQAVMVAGYAEIAQAFADRLKDVPEVDDFRILRINGDEAFRDNKTIEEVNERLGEEEFIPRDKEEIKSLMASDHPELLKAVDTREIVAFYNTSSDGERFLTYLAPIKNQERCHKCHGKESAVRGLIKLTTSLKPVHLDILSTRNQSIMLLCVVIAVSMTMMAIMVRYSVVKPVRRVTNAMLRASKGDLTHTVPVPGRDEISRMAGSFNLMIEELLKTHTGLRNEQDKLTTIILTAREGIIVTDNQQNIVLVNPAAKHLLGKEMEKIVHDGFFNLFDDPELMKRNFNPGAKCKPFIIEYNDLILSVCTATISLGDKNNTIGSAALLRDITEEKRLEERLRSLSYRDGLTGLYNRRYLDQRLEEEINRCNRYGQELSIFMFDVDHFKRFNDEHGHDQGDRVLQEVGRVLQDTLRKVDKPCRYGGEGFLAILPNTSLKETEYVAERLRTDIEQMRVDGLQVTISIGIAQYPESGAPCDPKRLVEAADAALYEAKRGGRNCVRVSRQAA